jgi:hypothetical protein
MKIERWVEWIVEGESAMRCMARLVEKCRSRDFPSIDEITAASLDDDPESRKRFQITAVMSIYLIVSDVYQEIAKQGLSQKIETLYQVGLFPSWSWLQNMKSENQTNIDTSV